MTIPGCKTSFNSCLGRTHIADGHVENFSTLQVKGKAVRKIAWLAPRNFDHLYYRDGINNFLDLDGHTEVLRQHLEIQRGMNAPQVAQRWSNLRHEVLRTLLADGAFGSVQPLLENIEKLQTILAAEHEIMETKRKGEAGEYVLNREIWQTDYVILKKLFEWALIAQKKVMFVTERMDGVDGPDSIHLGLAASKIQVNDVIAVLHGSQAPVVLRPAEASENQWHVISQCYLEGWMYENDVRNKVCWSDDESDTFLLV